MRVRHAAKIGMLALGLCLAAGALAAEPTGATTPTHSTVSGTLKFVFSLDVTSSIDNGVVINIGPQAVVEDDTYFNFSEMSGTVKTSGSKASLTLLLPFVWQVASKDDTVMINVYVTAQKQKNSGTTYNSSTFTKTIALPASGKTTTVNITGAI